MRRRSRIRTTAFEYVYFFNGNQDAENFIYLSKIKYMRQKEMYSTNNAWWSLKRHFVAPLYRADINIGYLSGINVK